MDGAWLIVNCSCWTDVYPEGTITQCLYPAVTRLVPMQDYSTSAYTDQIHFYSLYSRYSIYIQIHLIILF